MSSQSTPSVHVTLPVFLGLFFGGGVLGVWVADALAPGSGLAELAGFLSLPAAFMAGIVAWAGAAIPEALRRLFRRPSSPPPEPVQVIPGSFAFVPAAVAVCLAAGAVVGAVSPLGFLQVLGVYALLGLAYGLVCWRLARAGYLAFPTE